MCVQYWPAGKNREEIYSGIGVTVENEEQLANFMIRTIRMRKVRCYFASICIGFQSWISLSTRSMARKEKWYCSIILNGRAIPIHFPMPCSSFVVVFVMWWTTIQTLRMVPSLYIASKSTPSSSKRQKGKYSRPSFTCFSVSKYEVQAISRHKQNGDVYMTFVDIMFFYQWWSWPIRRLFGHWCQHWTFRRRWSFWCLWLLGQNAPTTQRSCGNACKLSPSVSDSWGCLRNGLKQPRRAALISLRCLSQMSTLYLFYRINTNSCLKRYWSTREALILAFPLPSWPIR